LDEAYAHHWFEKRLAATGWPRRMGMKHPAELDQTELPRVPPEP
jgi:hypothetical protein